MSGSVVWRAEAHEAETVARLLVAFRDDLGKDWPSENAFLASVERLIERPAEAEFLLGALDGDSPPAGVCQLRYRQSVWTAAADCWLEDLFVGEPARGAGLGAALLEGACAHANARGCRRIELDVSELNFVALALYESRGFSAKSPSGRDLFMGLHLGD